MVTDFLKKATKLLTDQQFTLSSQLGGEENTQVVVLVKNLSPIFYVVFLLDGSRLDIDRFERERNVFLKRAEENLPSYFCSRLISLQVIACPFYEKGLMENINQKEILPESQTLSVWWQAALNEKKLYAAKGHPDEILQLKKLFTAAMDTEAESLSFEEIAKTALQRGELKEKTAHCHGTMILLVINIAVWVTMTLSGSESYYFTRYGLDAMRVTHNGEIYRILTSMFLHAGMMHLAYNCLSLYIFGSRTEKYFGTIPFLAVYFLSGLGGALGSILFTRGLAVGASGAIYGLLGAVLALSRQSRKTVDGLNYFTILMIVLTGLALGFAGTGIDNFAHIGGFVTGFLLSYLYLKLSPFSKGK